MKVLGLAKTGMALTLIYITKILTLPSELSKDRFRRTNIVYSLWAHELWHGMAQRSVRLLTPLIRKVLNSGMTRGKEAWLVSSLVHTLTYTKSTLTHTHSLTIRVQHTVLFLFWNSGFCATSCRTKLIPRRRACCAHWCFTIYSVKAPAGPGVVFFFFHHDCKANWLFMQMYRIVNYKWYPSIYGEGAACGASTLVHCIYHGYNI